MDILAMPRHGQDVRGTPVPRPVPPCSPWGRTDKINLCNVPSVTGFPRAPRLSITVSTLPANCRSSPAAPIAAYPFNVFSEKKFQETLDRLHNNPVERRLVGSPSEWPWSSGRLYYGEDASILRMVRRR